MADSSDQRIYLSPPHVGETEREMLLRAFESNWIAPVGPDLDAFEREVCAHTGAQHAVAVSSGTAALHLALQVLGVGPGDEVITSTLTFVASANAISYLGAKPIFIDSDSDTWNMAPALLEEALESRARKGTAPKVAVVVDLYGQCADYDVILESCSRHDVLVVEDAAEALGATYRERHAGTLGALGVFSFNGNKIITTSGGGMLVSGRRDWIERARYLATQARQPAAHYEHTEVGFNYRMSNLLAAVGRGQLRSLKDKIERRRQINRAYRAALANQPGIELMPEAPYGRCTFWLTCLTVDPAEYGADRDAIIEHLAAHDIEARPVWKPMHLQPLYRDCEVFGGAVSERLFQTGVCLPSGSNLDEGDLARITRALGTVPRHARRGK